jgi:hypothetical protein
MFACETSPVFSMRSTSDYLRHLPLMRLVQCILNAGKDTYCNWVTATHVTHVHLFIFILISHFSDQFIYIILKQKPAYLVCLIYIYTFLRHMHINKYFNRSYGGQVSHLMYIINSKGPNIEPSGIPLRTEAQFEKTPFSQQIQ